jgi:hypothetical protein
VVQADQRAARRWLDDRCISFAFAGKSEFMPNPDFVFPAPQPPEVKAGEATVPVPNAMVCGTRCSPGTTSSAEAMLAMLTQ